MGMQEPRPRSCRSDRTALCLAYAGQIAVARLYRNDIQRRTRSGTATLHLVNRDTNMRRNNILNSFRVHRQSSPTTPVVQNPELKLIIYTFVCRRSPFARLLRYTVHQSTLLSLAHGRIFHFVVATAILLTLDDIEKYLQP